MTKRAVINVRSMDNACLAWSVAALYPSERNADRESSYPHYTMMLNLNLEFLIILKDVTKFEGLNDVSINICGMGQKTLFLFLLMTERETCIYYICKIYLRDDYVRHFIRIKNLSQLMSLQLSKHHDQKFATGI